jgi:hypothetical protein
LLCQFSRLESYLEKDYMKEFIEESKDRISTQLKEWNKIKHDHKIKLFMFIQKVIKGQEKNISKFYQNFSIATTSEEFNCFIQSQNHQLSQYNQMKTYSHIFDAVTEKSFIM